jgi:disulfide bond formation protein DsbB
MKQQSMEKKIRRAPRLLTALVGLGLMASMAGCTVDENAAPAGGDEPEAVAEDSGLGGDEAHGAELFTPCAGCHGQDAKGIQGLGKDLHANAFLAGMTDQEIVDFLKTGRPAADPLNTTGVDMPPKGGDPSLSDTDLADVVAYLRTLD